MGDMERLTDGIRRLCGVMDGVRDNEFAEITVRKAAVAEACDRLDEAMGAARDLSREAGRVEGRWEAEAELAPRLMPEGMEWPRFEDGGPVRIGDVVSDVEVRSVVFRDGGILLSDCTSVPGWGTWRSYKEPIKRPAVLAADGEPLEAGQTVWDEHGDEFRVLDVYGGPVDEDFPDHTVRCRRAGAEDYESTMCAPSQLTHRAPVLAVDGMPLREGEHVYHVETGAELVVKELPKPGEYQAVVVFALPTSPASHLTSFDPDRLTHERPDSWERLEEDRDLNPFDYCKKVGHHLDTCENAERYKSRDLVRRCRALAEKENKNE